MLTEAGQGSGEDFGLFQQGPPDDEEESPSNNDTALFQMWPSLSWEDLGAPSTVG